MLLAVTAACSGGTAGKAVCDGSRGDVLVFAPAQEIGDHQLSQAAAVVRKRLTAYGHDVAGVCGRHATVLVDTGARLDAGQRLQIAELLERNVRLEMRPVLAEIRPSDPGYHTAPPRDCERPLLSAPRLPAVLCEQARDGERLKPSAGWTKLRLGPSVLTAEDVARAEPEPAAGGDGWQVLLVFTERGARAFEAVTGKLACERDVRRRLAIAIDGIVVSSPATAESLACNAGIRGGEAVVTVGSEAEARRLAADLAGVLPMPLRLASTSGEGAAG